MKKIKTVGVVVTKLGRNDWNAAIVKLTVVEGGDLPNSVEIHSTIRFLREQIGTHVKR